MTLPFLAEQFANFTTVFLGIFIEAAPFLLMGTLASGLVEVFISRDQMLRVIPRRRIMATIAGGFLGLVFPVCECGVVPLTRRLFRKGLPVSSGVAFLLAAPIINPIVFASTFAAYGWGPIFVMRFVMGAGVALFTGLVFSANPDPSRMLLPQHLVPVSGGSGEAIDTAPVPPLGERLTRSLRIGADEFFDMVRYLIVGSMLAAALQTAVPQSALLALGSGPVTSVITLQVLAFILSVCSTVDAFLSLAFVNTFTPGSILAFLVFGPMLDIKSTLLFLSVFERRVVAYLLLIPLLATMLVALFINLNVNW
ncbi:MAG: permease [Anaerolineae bacterium]|nr:permease [Anaerolineae bacterium]